MSNITYTLTEKPGEQSTISVFADDFERVLPETHPNFRRVVNFFLDNPQGERDPEALRLLVDPALAIGKALQEEFGARVTFDLHHFYLDGIPETGLLAEHVRDQVLSGNTDWMRLARFLVRLQDNPSKRAKEAIWEWVEKHGVTITEDGRMVGYKGLVWGTDAVTGERNIPVSYHSGPNNFIDGALYGQAGVSYQVPHRLGSVISKRRADVDDNTSLACSTGLHVGAYSYAKTFGENIDDAARYSTMGKQARLSGTFALVAFAPEDVVSVPEDGTADWKIRVERYEVVEFLSSRDVDVLKDQKVYDVQTAAPFLPKGEEYVDESVEQPEPFEPEPLGLVDHARLSLLEDQEDDEKPVVPVTDAGDGLDDEARLSLLENQEEVEDYEEDSLSPRQRDRYNALVHHVGHEAALQDAREWPEEELVRPAQGTGLNGALSLRDWAEVNPGLKADLASDLGHTAVALKYADITTESSVRRYRKALNG